MALIVPQAGLPDLFLHYRGRSKLSQHVHRPTSTFPSSTDAACSSSHRELPRSSKRRSLQCAAVTGGSKRDVEKLVARTQHRRPRHKKGMTPSKIDLIEELEEEEEGEDVVEDEVNQLVSEDTMSAAEVSDGLDGPSVGEDEPRRDSLAEKSSLQGMDGKESDQSNDGAEVNVVDATPSTTDARIINVSNDAAEGAKGILESTEDTVGGVADTVADTQKQVVSDAVEGGESLIEGMDGKESEELNDGAEGNALDVTPSTTDSRIENVSNDAAEGAKGILESTEDTVGGVVDTVADTQKQVVSDAVEGGESLIEGLNDAVKNASTSPSSDKDVLADEGRQSPETISDITIDTASDVGNKVDETGQQVGQDMTESASSIREAFDSQTEDAMRDFKKQAKEAEASANAVADVAKDTSEFLNQKARETGKQVGQDLAEVASTGWSLFEDGSQALSEQAEDGRAQAEKFLEEERKVLEQGTARLQNEASESLNRVQNSVQKAVQESARAARSIGLEALGMGELLVDTARETAQATFANAENKRSYGGERSNQKDKGSSKVPSQSQVGQQEDTSQFSDFKVLVAGASGQTGRLIVEKLMSKGVSVRALVRDANKAPSIQQLKDCECVEADLYKYETVKKAIGDCNVIICAIGARAFPLDPFSTYQVEYEGVLNLISAAKNQGKVKKFILVSTIGVTYLQLVPLLFWKKQAELYLQRSGLDYTIVRPGGLRNTNQPEDVIMQGADSQFFGGISRRKVAEVCIAALTTEDASDKVVEVVSVPGPQRRSIDELFKLV